MHNENTTDLYFTLGRKLGRLLYEGRWFDPEALMLKEALTRWVAPAVTGTVTPRASARRRLHDPRHEGRAQRLRARTSSRWRRPTAPSRPKDRIGALEMQSLGVLDNRELLLHFAKALGAGDGAIGGLMLGSGDDEGTG